MDVKNNLKCALITTRGSNVLYKEFLRHPTTLGKRKQAPTYAT